MTTTEDNAATAGTTEPKIYRTMVFDTGSDGRRYPQVGSDRNMLGVRLPPSTYADVVPDSAGKSCPAARGSPLHRL